MSDDQQFIEVLETPPRSTGDAQQDFPLVIDYVFKTYQKMVEAVNFINNQINAGVEISVNDLPDPTNATIASAQNTANLAFAEASSADAKADANILDIDVLESDLSNLEADVSATESDISGLQGSVTALQSIVNNADSGTFTISDTDNSATINFSSAQADTNYTVFVQPKSSSGTPAMGAFLIASKTYNTGNFLVTLSTSPLTGNSVTFDWHLLRNP